MKTRLFYVISLFLFFFGCYSQAESLEKILTSLEVYEGKKMFNTEDFPINSLNVRAKSLFFKAQFENIQPFSVFIKFTYQGKKDEPMPILASYSTVFPLLPSKDVKKNDYSFSVAFDQSSRFREGLNGTYKVEFVVGDPSLDKKQEEILIGSFNIQFANEVGLFEIDGRQEKVSRLINNFYPSPKMVVPGKADVVIPAHQKIFGLVFAFALLFISLFSFQKLFSGVNLEGSVKIPITQHQSFLIGLVGIVFTLVSFFFYLNFFQALGLLSLSGLVLFWGLSSLYPQINLEIQMPKDDGEEFLSVNETK